MEIGPGTNYSSQRKKICHFDEYVFLAFLLFPLVIAENSFSGHNCYGSLCISILSYELGSVSCKYFGIHLERGSNETRRWVFLFQCLILKCLLNKKIYTMCSMRQKLTLLLSVLNGQKFIEYLSIYLNSHTKLENCALWVCWMQVRINQLFLSGGHWGHSLADCVLKCIKHSIPRYHIVPELLLPQLLRWGIWWGQGMWKQKNYYIKDRPVLKQPESASVL